MITALIERLATENHGWGYQRGESRVGLKASSRKRAGSEFAALAAVVS